MSRIRTRLLIALGVMTAVFAATVAPALASPPVSGAVFTTNAACTGVDLNIYAAKTDVYIDGGPAKLGAAGLPDGSYYVQVTDPSGATVLGKTLTASVSVVNGEFAQCYQLTDILYTGSSGFTAKGYDDTPNNGGEYKVWVSNVSTFDNNSTKTDNFKVGPPGTTPPGKALEGQKTATGHSTRTYNWTLSKSCSPSRTLTNANTAQFSCSVTVTETGFSDGSYYVDGSIDAINNNNADVTGVTVSDNIGDPNAICVVTGGTNVTVPANGDVELGYTCTYSAAPASSSQTNTATITWPDQDLSNGSHLTGATIHPTASVDWTAVTPTLVNQTVTVTDPNASPTTLGTATAVDTTPFTTKTFNFTWTVNTPTAGCGDFTNTATITETGQTASATVTVCRTNSNGFTMGYWQNKNGQAQIGTAVAGLCTYLAAYPNVLTLPSPCTKTALQNYVTSVIKAANAAGDGAPMFKGQFLATALSAYFSSSLASTGIAVDSGIFGSSCMTVSALLTFGNTNYASLSLNKTTFMAVKSVYDSINNDIAITC
jgi:hypothetical protein